MTVLVQTFTGQGDGLRSEIYSPNGKHPTAFGTRQALLLNARSQEGAY